MTGCRTKSNEVNTSATTINISESNLFKNLSNIITDIEYIPLASDSTQSYLSEFKKVLIKNDKIFFLQGNEMPDNSVMAFDINDGRFLFNIYSPGEGPGRVYTSSDIYVNSDNDEIELLDQLQQKILIFDKFGKFKREVTGLPAMYSQFTKLRNSNYLFYTGNFPIGQNHKLHITDVNLNIINSYFDYEDFHQTLIISNQDNFSASSNSGYFLFHEIMNDIVYEACDNNVSPKYFIDFGNLWVKDDVISQLRRKVSRAVTKKELLNNSSHVFSIVTTAENDKYFFFTYFYKNKLYWNFYDKNKKNLFSSSEIENDIDKGVVGEMKFWPMTIYNNNLIFILEAPDILANLKDIADKEGVDVEALPNKFPGNKYYQLSKKLKFYNNPVIAIAYLK